MRRIDSSIPGSVSARGVSSHSALRSSAAISDATSAPSSGSAAASAARRASVARATTASMSEAPCSLRDESDTRSELAAMLEVAHEPGARELPIALHRARRRLHHLGDALRLQSTEEAQLHHARLARVLR